MPPSPGIEAQSKCSRPRGQDDSICDSVILAQALSTLFAWAIDKDHVAGASPTAGIKQLRTSKSERKLADDEIVDILTCLDVHVDEFGDYGPIIKLLALTGCR